MRRIKAILEAHGIKWKVENGKMLVLSQYTLHGEPYQEWEACPVNEKALLKWLGY